MVSNNSNTIIEDFDLPYVLRKSLSNCRTNYSSFQFASTVKASLYYVLKFDNEDWLQIFWIFRFKDGKAYPWPGDVSSFILYPESANQTIYSQALGSVDAGNYTCTVANESQVLTHTAALTVFGLLHLFWVVGDDI